ncbi:hypothetical protein ACWHLZ_04120 [Streptomyces chartreusis]
MEGMKGRGSREVVQLSNHFENLPQRKWIVPAFSYDAFQTPVQVNQAGWVHFELVDKALSGQRVLSDFDAHQLVAGVVHISLGVTKDQRRDLVGPASTLLDRQRLGRSTGGHTHPESETMPIRVLEAGTLLNGPMVSPQGAHGGLDAIEEPGDDPIACLGRSCTDGIEAHYARPRLIRKDGRCYR